MALENFLGISNEKLITSFAETLYMVGISLIIATVIAFILAVVLIFTRKGGLDTDRRSEEQSKDAHSYHWQRRCDNAPTLQGVF